MNLIEEKSICQIENQMIQGRAEKYKSEDDVFRRMEYKERMVTVENI